MNFLMRFGAVTALWSASFTKWLSAAFIKWLNLRARAMPPAPCAPLDGDLPGISSLANAGFTTRDQCEVRVEPVAVALATNGSRYS
jgi:hypothetical protein